MAAKFVDQIPVIKDTLRGFPGGASRAELAAALPEPPDDRTLQGWLQTLVGTGSIRREGEDADARFFAVVTEAPATSSQPSSLNSQPADSAPAIDPEFSGMFDLGLVCLVTTRLPRDEARTYLQRQAVEFKKAGPAMKAYVEYAMERLDTLTVADATDTYGFTAEQFTRWQDTFRNGRALGQRAGQPASRDAEFASMLERSLPDIVGGRRNRAETTSFLRLNATTHGKVGGDIGAYIQYGLARLDALTPADAAPAGFTPEDFKAWKAAYTGSATAEAVGTDSGATSTFAKATADKEVPAPGPSSVLCPPPSDRLSSDLRPLPSGTASSEPDPFSAEGLLRSMHHAKSDAYKKYAFDVIKSLLTPLRIGICLGLAIALKLGLRDVIPMGSMATLIVFPLAGLPWVFFRWLDETDANRLTGREALIVLLAGGVVSVFVANGVMAIIFTLESAAR